MTELDQLIAKAYSSGGKPEDTNKVYLIFLRSLLYVPVKKDAVISAEEPFKPLFAIIDEQYYLLAFDTLERLHVWAGEYIAELSYVELSGEDLIKGINEGVFLYLNQGSPYLKEFSPDEVRHLKKIVARIEQFKATK